MAEAEPDFFSDPEVIDHPIEYFNAMRAKCPVAREPYQGALMVTGYDEAMALLNVKDGTWSASVNVLGPLAVTFEPHGDDISAQLDAARETMPWSDHLACYDGEKHTTHRDIMTRLLTYKRFKQNEEYLYGLADTLIDRFIARGECEVMREYAHATTTYAISDLLGIPEEDRPVLLEAIGAPPSQLDGDAEMKVGTDPLVGMKPLFDGYFRERLDNPGSDLMSELSQAVFRDGRKLPFETMSLMARFLFGAGQDTTSRLIAMAMRILADDKALAGPPARRAEPHSRFPRGSAALRSAGEGWLPAGGEEHRTRRAGRARRYRRHCLPDRRQPRSEAFRRAGEVRHRPAQRARSHGLQPRPPRLSGRAAGPHGIAHRDRAHPRADDRHPPFGRPPRPAGVTPLQFRADLQLPQPCRSLHRVYAGLRRNRRAIAGA